jgi:hypothetical protein
MPRDHLMLRHSPQDWPRSGNVRSEQAGRSRRRQFAVTSLRRRGSCRRGLACPGSSAASHLGRHAPLQQLQLQPQCAPACTCALAVGAVSAPPVLPCSHQEKIGILAIAERRPSFYPHVRYRARRAAPGTHLRTSPLLSPSRFSFSGSSALYNTPPLALFVVHA